MNADRRHTAAVCIELIKECLEIGEMAETSHAALSEAVKHLTSSEFWQLKNQERHAGKNAATDKQIAICKVALPALEQASEALKAGDMRKVIRKLNTAMTTDGQKPKRGKVTQ